MGIDMADFFRLYARVPDGVGHGHGHALAAFVRRSHVPRIRACAITDKLGNDCGAPGFCGFQILKQQQAGAFGHDKTIAFGVKGSGCLRGLVIEMGGKGLESRETGHAQGGDCRFHAARDHAFGASQQNGVESRANGVNAGSAGRCRNNIGTLGAGED